ncbi:hypothetical protein C0J52_26262 [Blattella germanica]|nr:hypothetical protein C0J52_26262 [Blattella germanica]
MNSSGQIRVGISRLKRPSHRDFPLLHVAPELLAICIACMTEKLPKSRGYAITEQRRICSVLLGWGILKKKSEVLKPPLLSIPLQLILLNVLSVLREVQCTVSPAGGSFRSHEYCYSLELSFTECRGEPLPAGKSGGTETYGFTVLLNTSPDELQYLENLQGNRREISVSLVAPDLVYLIPVIVEMKGNCGLQSVREAELAVLVSARSQCLVLEGVDVPNMMGIG